jgi:hypothetical protein
MTEPIELIQRENFELQISVARIEGMLSASLARHDQRLDQHEGTLNQVEIRLREKGTTIARHDERIKDLEEDNSGRLGRITGTIGALVGVAALLWAIFSPSVSL